MMSKWNSLTVSALTLTLLYSTTSQADALSAKQKADVNQIIQLFKTPDSKRIAQHIQYPLPREYPLTDVQNAVELQTRFKQIFDAKLIKTIAQSQPSQWSSVGWRGVMLEDGIVWLQDNQISAVNHLSDTEKNLKQQLIQQQKTKLHPSLRNFTQPIMTFQTTQYLVRIDELASGKYRYSSWKKAHAQSTRPDLVLNNGEVTFEGTGGNHVYHFKSGVYTYSVDRNLMGATESSEVNLNVTKHHKTLINQSGHILND